MLKRIVTCNNSIFLFVKRIYFFLFVWTPLQNQIPITRTIHPHSELYEIYKLLRPPCEDGIIRLDSITYEVLSKRYLEALEDYAEQHKEHDKLKLDLV